MSQSQQSVHSAKLKLNKLRREEKSREKSLSLLGDKLSKARDNDRAEDIHKLSKEIAERDKEMNMLGDEMQKIQDWLGQSWTSNGEEIKVW